ncbi:MAG: hypothetical protein U0446_06770 [Dehalococcoidia bacterium]
MVWTQLARACRGAHATRAALVAAFIGIVLWLALGSFWFGPAPGYGHGTVDQEFPGPFTASPPLTSGLAQSFTPTQPRLVAVDVFLSTDDAVVETATEITVSVVEMADWSSAVGVATVTVPPNTRSTNANPYTLHADFSPVVTLTPETRYVIRLGGAPAYRWAAEISAPYTRGIAYVAGNPIDAYDFGFRTYFEPAAPSDTTPPVISYTLSSPLPASGWYRTDITLDWTVTDNESTPALDGCEDRTVTSDRDQAAYSCSASSAGGSAGPVTVTFGRDTVAPTIEATVTAGTRSNGWYRSDVSVGFTCFDDRSGITDGGCPATQILSTEGSAVASTARTVVDRAGNESASSNVVTVQIDQSPPIVSVTPSRAPDVEGAYDHEVSFTASGEDGTGSGVALCDPTATYSGPPDEDASVEMTCTDLAGNIGHATYHFTFVEPSDTTRPTISAAITSGTKGSGDWYVSKVVVHFTCDDEDSGIPDGNCPEDETLSAEGAAVSSTARTVFDAAGNESEPSNVVTVSIDRTPPNAQADVTPVPNPAGWHSTGVTVTFSGSDAISGGVVCDPPVTLTSDGAGQSASGSCADLAGNTQSATAIHINIDRTKPSVTISPDRSPDSAAGYDHPVAFTASASDGGSGVAYCDPPESYSGPLSSSASVEMSCADNAGNIGSATFEFKYVDSTPPVIGFTLSPSLPAGGWYSSNVTLIWSVTEAESSDTLLLVGCVNQAVTADRPYTKYSCGASSAGGEASVVEVEFGRDATKPALAAEVLGTAGTGGWFTDDVTVRFTCTDAGSGVASDTVPDATLNSEGASQSVTSGGSCVDHAGNVADPLTVSNINLDTTGPNATLAVVSGTLGLNGWYTSDIVVRTSGSDSTSGPVTCTADQTLTVDIQTRTFEGSCTNAAGLATGASSLTVKLDKTAPQLAPALSLASVTRGGALTVEPNASDATSGIASSSCGSIDTSVVGKHSLACSATDRAGNSATSNVTYEVTAGAGAIVYGAPPPRTGGYGTFSFTGGTFEELLAASGCPRTSAVFFYNKTDGAFAVWIPGAEVQAVNAEFLALFGNSPPLPDGSIFTARCV